MTDKKSILTIIGSTSKNSSNLKLVEQITVQTIDEFELTIYNDKKNTNGQHF